jgi:CBS domain-containing protein
MDSDAVEAARMLAEHGLPGLVVADLSGQPYGLLPTFEVLRFVLPLYVQDDLALAGVLGDMAADHAMSNLTGKTVGDLLQKQQRNIPSVDARDTVIKVAAKMTQLKAPLVAVIKDGKLHGVITASRLLAVALKS